MGNRQVPRHDGFANAGPVHLVGSEGKQWQKGDCHDGTDRGSVYHAGWICLWGGSPGVLRILGAELERWVHDELAKPQVLLMGRVTYEALADISQHQRDEVARRMNDLPKVVFSKTLREPVDSRVTRCAGKTMSGGGVAPRQRRCTLLDLPELAHWLTYSDTPWGGRSITRASRCSPTWRPAAEEHCQSLRGHCGRG